MKIVTIEPTPSPNTMKVILDEELAAGRSNNYKADNVNGVPETIRKILQIDGVKGVYHVADFLAVDRNGKYSREEILTNVSEALGADGTSANTNSENVDVHIGE